jgi:hypothetical protein
MSSSFHQEDNSMPATLTEKQQFWLNHVKTAEASGLSFKAYADDAQIDPKSLYNWKAKFIQKSILNASKPKPFVKVATKLSRDTESQLRSPRGQTVKVQLPNGIQLTFETLSREALRLLLAL